MKTWAETKTWVKMRTWVKMKTWAKIITGAIVLSVLIHAATVIAQPVEERQWGRIYLGVVANDGRTVAPVRATNRLPVDCTGTVTCAPSGIQQVAGTVAATQGTTPWVTQGVSYLYDGAGNAITSELDGVGTRRDLHVHDTQTAAAISALHQECRLNPNTATHIRRTTSAAFDIDPGEYGCFATGETVRFALGAVASATVGIPWVPGTQQDNCRITVTGAVAVEHSVHIGTVGVFDIVPCL